MARVIVDDCLDKVSNRFELVLLAATRARQLSAGQDALISKEGNKNPVTALREIAEGKISIPHLQEVLTLRFMGEPMVDDYIADSVNLDDVQDFNFFSDDDTMVHEVDALRVEDDVLPVDDTPPIDELV